MVVTRSRFPTGREFVQQDVLFGFEPGDVLDEIGTVPRHGRRVSVCLAMLRLRQRRLRHQRPQAGVVGLVVEVRALFVGNGHLLAQLRQATADHAKSAFDQESDGAILLRLDPRQTEVVSFVGSGRVLGVVVALVMVCIVAPACATPVGAACGPITIDPLNANESHLLAGTAGTPVFSQNPPTSGPHIAGAISRGVQHRVLTGVEQVSTLETGAVILQYGSVSSSIRTKLESKATDQIVVAPGTKLPAAVVATGWQRTMRCDRYDARALDEFIATVQGRYNAHTATASGS